jgi:hypothetical protein
VAKPLDNENCTYSQSAPRSRIGLQWNTCPSIFPAIATHHRAIDLSLHTRIDPPSCWDPRLAVMVATTYQEVSYTYAETRPFAAILRLSQAMHPDGTLAGGSLPVEFGASICRR